MSLKIAVISDLHCHNKQKNKNVQESYLLTDVKLPPNQDPLESFKKFVDKKLRENPNFSVDVLVMPGDISNKCCQDGFNHGWNITKEIARLLKAKYIIPTIGNHDVDSRKIFSSDPFHKIKNFAPDFPFISNSLNTAFWSKGYLFIELDNSRILVLNSAHDHRTTEDAEHGNISQETLNLLEDELKLLPPKAINIAICHHHPIPHERHHLGTGDLIFNGTQLVELLGQFNYQMVIHGHKHDPLIRYSSGGANSPVIFASGSFSAFKTLLLQGAYNTFHIVTVESEQKNDCENQGIIETWFFTPSKGWDSDVSNEYFLSKIGFGCRIPIRQLSRRVAMWFKTNNISDCSWEEFLPNFEMINYLLPVDKKLLGDSLRELNINVHPKFPLDPEIVSFKQ